MSKHKICPWWIGYLLASPIRRLLENPGKILGPHVQRGMTILEPGPGMGFFTLELLRLTGPSGRVVAVDIQPQMLHGLRRRAAKAGLDGHLETRVAQPDSLDIADLTATVDFVLAYAMVHELPESGPFFAEVSNAMKPGARLLLAEPAGHVKPGEFDAELQDAARAGLRIVDRPVIRRNTTALLEKPASAGM